MRWFGAIGRRFYRFLTFTCWDFDLPAACINALENILKNEVAWNNENIYLSVLTLKFDAMGIMSARICFRESDYHCFDVDHYEIVFWGKPFLSKGNLINLAFSAENYILGNVTIYSALPQCVKLLKNIETQII